MKVSEQIRWIIRKSPAFHMWPGHSKESDKDLQEVRCEQQPAALPQDFAAVGMGIAQTDKCHCGPAQVENHGQRVQDTPEQLLHPGAITLIIPLGQRSKHEDLHPENDPKPLLQWTNWLIATVLPMPIKPENPFSEELCTPDQIPSQGNQKATTRQQEDDEGHQLCVHQQDAKELLDVLDVSRSRHG